MSLPSSILHGAPGDTARQASPLALAAHAGDEAELRSLLAEGWRPDPIISGLGWPPVFHALIAGHLQCARLLLRAGASPDALDSRQWPLLANAANMDSPSGIELLLEFGARVDAECPDGSTALIVAAHAGNLQCCLALLAGGAHIMARDREGGHAASVAILAGRHELASAISAAALAHAERRALAITPSGAAGALGARRL